MPVSASDFAYLCKLIRDQSAIVLEPGKEYLVEARLLYVARRAGFANLEGLVDCLRTSSFNGLHRQVVEAMTTNETSFFRDLHPFEAFKKHVLPECLARRSSGQKLRIWSAACSSGQEPYSLAMLLKEHFPDLVPHEVQIMATDLSEEMVQRTRAGRFSQLEVNRGLPAALLVKYFKQDGGEWEIQEDLRHLLDVRTFNLNESWRQIPPMDVIFMRNVLIYFDVATKQAILHKLRQVLRPGGYLFLGTAETTLNLDDCFLPVQFDKTFCYQVA